MSTHWKAVFGVIVVFIFGCLSGWLGSSMVRDHETARMLQRDPDAITDLLERRLTRNLGLDENQKTQIHDILLENIRGRRGLQAQIQPEIQQINRETSRRINALLQPEQRKEFHDNMVQFRQRFGQNPFNPKAVDEAAPAGNAPVSGTPGGTVH